jgi:uncharacterized protein
MKRDAIGHLMLLIGAALLAGGCFPSACDRDGVRAAGDRIHDVTRESRALGGDAPDGFLAMEVMGVLPTAEGNAVFLVDAAHDRVLPIWIGPSEAMAIQLRMDRRRFERPLTHDLLDSLVKELGGQVLKIHVDDLKGSTFVGTVFVRRNGHVHSVDARPSDAIALAVGNRAPIYVAVEVLERAAISRDEIEGGFDEPPLDLPPYDDPPEGHRLRERDDPGIIRPPPTQAL